MSSGAAIDFVRCECLLCDVHLSNFSNFVSHLSGQKHAKKCDKLDEDGRRYCGICCCFVSEKNWMSHADGTRHTQAAHRYGYCDVCEEFIGVGEGARAVHDAGDAHKAESAAVDGKVWCRCCDRAINEQQWRSHCNGKTHRAAAREHGWCDVCDRDVGVANWGSHWAGKAHAEQAAKRSFCGLCEAFYESSSEAEHERGEQHRANRRAKAEESGRRYCEACDLEMNANNWPSHLAGAKHRAAVVWKSGGDVGNSAGSEQQSGNTSSTALSDKQESPAAAGVLLLDTASQVQNFVARVRRANVSHIAVDLEGTELCRSGTVALLQIAANIFINEPPLVGLVDITVLGAQAFRGTSENSLKYLLEDPSVTKILFDCRSDADALFHLYGVRLRGLLDLQVYHQLLFVPSKVPFLHGLGKAIDRLMKILDPAEHARAKSIKEAGVKLFAPEQGGSYAVWNERPLRPELLLYASQDVALLFRLLEDYSSHYPQSGRNEKLQKKVERISEERARAATEAEEPCRGKEKARRDF